MIFRIFWPTLQFFVAEEGKTLKGRTVYRFWECENWATSIGDSFPLRFVSNDKQLWTLTRIKWIQSEAHTHTQTKLRFEALNYVQRGIQ